MTEKLVIVYMVQNENNPFFRWSLQASRAIADHVVILDGRSEDGTHGLIKEVFNIPLTTNWLPAIS